MAEQAPDTSSREAFLSRLVAECDALHADPEQWSSELAERAAWDVTLADDLDTE